MELDHLKASQEWDEETILALKECASGHGGRRGGGGEGGGGAGGGGCGGVVGGAGGVGRGGG